MIGFDKRHMLQQVHSTGMNLHIKNAHLYITMPCLLIGKIRLCMQIFKAHYLFDRSLYQIFSAVVFSNPSSNLPWNSTSCILYCKRRSIISICSPQDRILSVCNQTYLRTMINNRFDDDLVSNFAKWQSCTI